MKTFFAFLLLASQMWASGYYCRSVTIDHTKVSSGTQTDFPWVYTNAAGVVGANLNSSDGSSTISVVDLTGVSEIPAIANGDYIQIESEQMLVTAGGGTASLTATRAQHSTTETTHSANVTILDLTQIAYLATVANGGMVANASGYDIYFSSSSTGASVLPYEQAYYDPTTGYGVWWIKETLSNSTDHVTYLCYGNSSITSTQTAPASVWSNGYAGVWHLRYPNYTDSLGVLNGTATGTLVFTSALLGGSTYFGGSAYVTVGGASALNLTTMTIEAWSGAINGSNAYMVFAKDALAASGGGYDIFNGAGALSFVFDDGTNQAIPRCSSCVTTTGFMSSVGWTLTGNTSVMYLDGASVAFSNLGGAATGILANALSATIGARPDGTYSMQGTIGDVRISNVLRSAGWLATEFNNQDSPGTFYSMGAASSVSGAPAQRGNIAYDQIKASDRTGNGSQLLTWTTTAPATSSATCTAGQIAFDGSGNLYWCYAANLWARIGPGGFSTSW
jgi:hypothetical protein